MSMRNVGQFQFLFPGYRIRSSQKSFSNNQKHLDIHITFVEKTDEKFSDPNKKLAGKERIFFAKNLSKHFEPTTKRYYPIHFSLFVMASQDQGPKTKEFKFTKKIFEIAKEARISSFLWKKILLVTKIRNVIKKSAIFELVRRLSDPVDYMAI